MSDDNYLKCSCKECGNHLEFPPESAGTVIPCPHCGQWTELIPEGSSPAANSSRSGLLTAAVVGVVVLAAAGGFLFFKNHHTAAVSEQTPPPVKVAVAPTNLPPATPPPKKAATNEKREKSPDDLKVGAVQLEKAKVGSLVYAVGVVTNASEFQRFGVKVELDLLNQSGKKIGATSDYKDIIEPNHEWQFHALIPDPRTKSAKVSSLKED